jgi:GT2 family glycosyltransferase
MPAVSVVIPNWDGEHLLPACLDSIRAQTARDFEIIVSDDASTDGSVGLVSQKYPEARVIRAPRNRGFAAAANAGVRATRGDLIFLLNNDVALDPRCLEELLRSIETDDGVGACAPKIIYYDNPSLINSAGHACGPDGIVVDIGRRQPDSDWFNRPREVLGACAGAAIYRRRMLDQIGLFDESFVMSFEDADLSWRAQWAGWRSLYVPTAVVRHREGASRGIASKRSTALGLRNSILVWLKDWPVGSLVRHCPDLWRGWRRSTVSLMARGHTGVVLSACACAFALMPRMMGRRWAIRRTRSAPAARFEELLALGARHSRQPPED